MISKLHYISQGTTPEEHLEHIQRACIAGADWVQLRLKKLDETVLLKTAQKAKDITDYFQTRLIINDHYKIAIAIKADGVHLGKNDACPLKVQKELASWQVIGGTANTFQDCEALIKKQIDYIGLGPYQFTSTKKILSPMLGKNGYLTIIEALKTTVPIIAIGGITVNDTEALMTTGIHGIAVSRAITSDFKNISEFNKILKGTSSNEQVWKVSNKK